MQPTDSTSNRALVPVTNASPAPVAGKAPVASKKEKKPASEVPYRGYGVRVLDTIKDSAYYVASTVATLFFIVVYVAKQTMEFILPQEQKKPPELPEAPGSAATKGQSNSKAQRPPQQSEPLKTTSTAQQKKISPIKPLTALQALIFALREVKHIREKTSCDVSSSLYSPIPQEEANKGLILRKKMKALFASLEKSPNVPANFLSEEESAEFNQFKRKNCAKNSDEAALLIQFLLSRMCIDPIIFQKKYHVPGREDDIKEKRASVLPLKVVPKKSSCFLTKLLGTRRIKKKPVTRENSKEPSISPSGAASFSYFLPQFPSILPITIARSGPRAIDPQARLTFSDKINGKSVTVSYKLKAIVASALPNQGYATYALRFYKGEEKNDETFDMTCFDANGRQDHLDVQALLPEITRNGSVFLYEKEKRIVETSKKEFSEYTSLSLAE